MKKVSSLRAKVALGGIALVCTATVACKGGGAGARTPTHPDTFFETIIAEPHTPVRVPICDAIQCPTSESTETPTPTATP